MNLVTTLGFGNIATNIRAHMLKILANRPNNDKFAEALRNLVEDPIFLQDLRTAEQKYLKLTIDFTDLVRYHLNDKGISVSSYQAK